MTARTYKQKCVFLMGGFFLFLILAYQLSFSETLSNRKEMKEREVKISWLKEKEKEAPLLQTKLSQISNVCREGDSSSVRDKLTAFISDFADKHDCMVTEIPQAHYYASQNSKIETNSFAVKGTFRDLLRLERAVEQNFGVLARVVSANFYTIRDHQSKKKNLFLKITTQSFTQLNHEDA